MAHCKNKTSVPLPSHQYKVSMKLLSIALFLRLIVTASSRTVHDLETTESPHNTPESPESGLFAEVSEELQNSVGSLNQSDVSAVSLLEERGEHTEDSNVKLGSKERVKHSGISKREITVTDAPDLCENVPIDSFVTTKDESTYVFKGEFYWKIIKSGNGFDEGYPRKILQDWDGLPGYIDAALTWPNDATFVFKGRWYWKFVDRYMDPGYPRLISEGFPGIPDYLDAAVVLHNDEKAYFFKGHKYWQYDRTTGVNDGYPKNIVDDWRGLPSYLDAAFRWTNNRTYFFKDDLYYRIIDSTHRVDPQVFSAGRRYPLNVAEEWFAGRDTPQKSKK